VGVAVVPAVLCSSLISISISADRAVVDASVDPDGFDGIFLYDSIPQTLVL